MRGKKFLAFVIILLCGLFIYIQSSNAYAIETVSNSSIDIKVGDVSNDLTFFVDDTVSYYNVYSVDGTVASVEMNIQMLSSSLKLCEVKVKGLREGNTTVIKTVIYNDGSSVKENQNINVKGDNSYGGETAVPTSTPVPTQGASSEYVVSSAEIEPNSSKATANKLVMGSLCMGEIGSYYKALQDGYDTDYYCFEVEADKSYKITLEPYSNDLYNKAALGIDLTMQSGEIVSLKKKLNESSTFYYIFTAKSSGTCYICFSNYVDSLNKQEHYYGVLVENINHTHSYDSGKIKTNASCGVDGVKVYTCVDCGFEKKEVIPKTGKHNFDYGSITKQATCAQKGERTYHCKNCSEVKIESIAKVSSHSYGTPEITKEASCVAKGEESSTCYVCGKVEKTSIPKTDHQWDTGKITRVETKKKDGIRKFTCVVCGKTRKENIHKLNISSVSITEAILEGKVGTVKYSSGGNAEGYHIRISKNKDMSSSKTYTSYQNNIIIENLEKKGVYYVQVCAFVTNSKNAIVEGTWSKKIRFDIDDSADAVLSDSKVSIGVGKEYTLKITGTQCEVKWKSSDSSVATVNHNGVVKGKKEGKVKITATVGKKTLTCSVTVEYKGEKVK